MERSQVLQQAKDLHQKPGRSFTVPSDSASRSDHSVEGQDGNPATPEWYHLPEQNLVPMGRSQVLQGANGSFYVVPFGSSSAN